MSNALWRWGDKTYETTTDAVAAVVAEVDTKYGMNPNGYAVADEDENEAFLQRDFAARDLATQVQQSHNEMYASREGGFHASPEQYAALTAIRDGSFGQWPHTWDCEVPLFVVTTDFEPFTESKMPVGKFVYSINPLDEVSFLDDLANIELNTPRRIKENW